MTRWLVTSIANFHHVTRKIHCTHRGLVLMEKDVDWWALGMHECSISGIKVHPLQPFFVCLFSRLLSCSLLNTHTNSLSISQTQNAYILVAFVDQLFTSHAVCISACIHILTCSVCCFFAVLPANLTKDPRVSKEQNIKCPSQSKDRLWRTQYTKGARTSRLPTPLTSPLDGRFGEFS